MCDPLRGSRDHGAQQTNSKTRTPTQDPVKESILEEPFSSPDQEPDTISVQSAISLSERQDDTLYDSPQVHSSLGHETVKSTLENTLVAVTSRMYNTKRQEKFKSPELDKTKFNDWTMPPNAVLIRKLPDPLTLSNVSAGPDQILSGGKEDRTENGFLNPPRATVQSENQFTRCAVLHDEQVDDVEAGNSDPTQIKTSRCDDPPTQVPSSDQDSQRIKDGPSNAETEPETTQSSRDTEVETNQNRA